ncbi:MAG: DUF2599 domain-containing protein [Cellulomonadaceae bacterium]
MDHRTGRRTLPALLCLVVLAGCGSATDRDSPPGTTTVTAATSSPAPSPTLDPTPPLPAIERVAWADDLEGGLSLQVFPTEHGRSATPAVIEQGWAEVIALVPEADTVTMARQFRCHALGAQDKPSWNLEPWRPDASFADVVLARCNPV